jgi:hypothetical protein
LAHQRGKPYAPQIKQQEQDKAIDLIVSSHWMLFREKCDPHRRLEEFMDFNKLSEPMLQIEVEKIEMPHLEGGYYHADNLIIEEVKEIE